MISTTTNFIVQKSFRSNVRNDHRFVHDETRRKRRSVGLVEQFYCLTNSVRALQRRAGRHHVELLHQRQRQQGLEVEDHAPAVFQHAAGAGQLSAVLCSRRRPDRVVQLQTGDGGQRASVSRSELQHVLPARHRNAFFLPSFLPYISRRMWITILD